MPTTPPLILPTNFPTWFHPKGESPARLEEFQLLNEGDISTFSYSPSEGDELLDELTEKQQSNHSSQRTTHELYHKPVSHRNSQQQSTTGTNERYQLDDDQMDATQSQRQQSQQSNRNEQIQTDTQQPCDEENLFESTMDQLNQEYKTYSEEYLEFKKHVDKAKQELLGYINERTEYFEQRGVYLNQKWDSLKSYI